MSFPFRMSRTLFTLAKIRQPQLCRQLSSSFLARQRRLQEAPSEHPFEQPLSPRERDSHESDVESRIDHTERPQEKFREKAGFGLGAIEGLEKISAFEARDLCQCPQCVDPSSKQKLFETSQISLHIKCDKAEWSEEKRGWTVQFVRDIPGYEDHTGFIPFDVAYSAVSKGYTPRQRTTWNREAMERDVLWVDYSEYSTTDAGLLKTLQRLSSHGLVFLRNVPESESSVIKIAERIGPLRDTFYGRTWDVKSVPDAKNIAYTHQYLGMHMDLLYMTNPPHLQLLHALKAQAPGGESLFCDSFHVADIIRRTDPSVFQALCFAPIEFHYKNASQYYRTTRTIFELDILGIEGGHGGSSTSERKRFTESRYLGKPEEWDVPRQPHISYPLRRVNWSPPFQAPFSSPLWEGSPQSSADKWRWMIGAMKAFSNRLNAEENIFELKLEEGDCVIFDNRRVVHARRAFDAQAGERWLKGAYVDDDVFFSRLRVLENSA